ncbi:unnamed protein product [Caenorhabditis angaria]|uniref:C2H2-type domain-containing protein n=1 Tax=Caenorhabditis angaria TaxID=860376 RepID=A0A9P1I5K8_9PELO|nr:unnamed protein product [Caenorhabditis angaria]
MTSNEPILNDDVCYKFIVPVSQEFTEEPIDMRMNKREQKQRTMYEKKLKELQKKNDPIMACSKCLLIFDDFLIYTIHMTMHGSNNMPLWFCSMCRQQCSNRYDFLVHTISKEHPFVPYGVSIPPDIPYIGPFPDLTIFLNNP